MKYFILSVSIFLLNYNYINSQVTQQWLMLYDGPGTGVDISHSIAVDRFGNVFITGESSGGNTSFDIATLKYNSGGTQLWAQRYNSSIDNGPDYGRSIGVDYAGNVYVAGDIYLLSTQADYVLIKYNTSGTQQWLRTYNAPDSSADRCYSLAVDSAGNSFITGYSYGGSHSADIVTIKYSSGGTQQWIQRYNNPSNGWDEPTQVVIDRASNVYVCGSTQNSGTGIDFITIKYNSSGVQQWLQLYSSSGVNNDEASSLAVDDSGNVFVTGYASVSGQGHNFLTVKYNPSGAFQWALNYNGPPNLDDDATCIKADHSGNVFAGGTSRGSSNTDYAVVKYSSGGVQQWVRRYNSGYADVLNAMALDKNGNVYVTGNCNSGSQEENVVTIRYDSDSTLKWMQSYNGVDNRFDWGLAIAVDTSFNVYVTGQSWVLSHNDNYLTIKYSQVVGVKSISNEVPKEFSLSQNYPNPFNPKSVISFQLSVNSFSTLRVYDLLGCEIATLVNEQLKPGTYEARFDASNFSSGIYYYTLTANASTQFSPAYKETKKMILIK